MRISLLLTGRKAPACKQSHLRHASSIYVLQLHDPYMYIHAIQVPMIRTLDYAPRSNYIKYLLYLAKLGVMHGCWLLLPEDTLKNTPCL